MRLEILHDGQIVYTHPLGTTPVCLGRSAANDVVLMSPSVSGHHAMIFVEGGEPVVRDCGSTNGTYVGQARLTGDRVVEVGELIRIGFEIQARVMGDSVDPGLLLERLDDVVAWPVDAGIWSVPNAPGARLRVSPTEVWLIVDGMEREEVQLDRPFMVHDVRYRLVCDACISVTVRPQDQPFPYGIVIDLDAQQAVLSFGKTKVSILSANRVAFLYVLGKAWLEGTCSWVRDDVLMMGIWGRAHRDHTPNNLNVLLHRIRVTVDAAGLDRMFVERRRGRTRLRVAQVRIL